MYLAQAIYILLTISNVYAFIYNPFIFQKLNKISLRAKMDMSNDYLENINRYTGYLDVNKQQTSEEKNIKKLEGIRKNITKYITSQKDDKKLEAGVKSTFRPIPKATFDTIFMNINQIKRLYISANVDRIIFEMRDGRRYVYYIIGKDDYKKMEQLMALIPTDYKSIIINDVHNTMDDPFGFLYCDKK